MRSWRSDGSISFRYFHQDPPGSIAVITDENGSLPEPRDSYGANGSGRRRCQLSYKPLHTSSRTGRSGARRDNGPWR